MRSYRPTRTSAPPSPVFRISTFSFPHYEEGEYSGSRGAAEHAEKIQSSSLRALRASAGEKITTPFVSFPLSQFQLFNAPLFLILSHV